MPAYSPLHSSTPNWQKQRDMHRIIFNKVISVEVANPYRYVHLQKSMWSNSLPRGILSGNSFPPDTSSAIFGVLFSLLYSFRHFPNSIPKIIYL